MIKSHHSSQGIQKKVTYSHSNAIKMYTKGERGRERDEKGKIFSYEKEVNLNQKVKYFSVFRIYRIVSNTQLYVNK